MIKKGLKEFDFYVCDTCNKEISDKPGEMQVYLLTGYGCFAEKTTHFCSRKCLVKYYQAEERLARKRNGKRA